MAHGARNGEDLGSMNNSSAPAVTADTRTISLETRISRQAYQLWESYGRPEGRDVAIWLEAERQVLGADPQVSAAQSGSVAAPALQSAQTPHAPKASTPDAKSPEAKPSAAAGRGKK